jgi:uncharacterized protein
MIIFRRAALLLTIGLTLMSGCDSDPKGNWVEIGGERFTVELATTPNAQFLGMGGRDNVPSGTGMLFIFPREAPRTFVMRSCLVPLDIAFIDDDGLIVTMDTMTVEPDQRHLTHYPSGVPASLVLEVAGGTFEKSGISEGQRVTFSPSVQRAIDDAKRSGR